MINKLRLEFQNLQLAVVQFFSDFDQEQEQRSRR